MQTTVSIPGIHCESCAALIKDVSSEFPVITNVTVDLSSKTVQIEHGNEFDFASWKQAIEASGEDYKVQPHI